MAGSLGQHSVIILCSQDARRCVTGDFYHAHTRWQPGTCPPTADPSSQYSRALQGYAPEAMMLLRNLDGGFGGVSMS
ncbi:hypothetical protein Y1Q_0001817 [Alligator mississippiensis]|uniref:Uncharacterized protein n=1 Tax=Alligator mississippiensis TaxID=8496 RepID=A0A151ML80_ALLMI|nr:hypothetical protein Y1Q_0001817 [Alligator mississippiensis]